MQANPNHRLVVQDRHFQHRYHDMWLNNPRIATRSERLTNVQCLRNCPGFRPYIANKRHDRWEWNEWTCPKGEIYFLPDELQFAQGFSPQLIIEPNNKQKASPNKDWGIGRWTELVTFLNGAGVRPTQLGSVGTRLIQGAKLIETPTFRHACAVLARAKCAVLPEGGLHHAAAAVGLPAIVIFGGFISPKQTGYAGHRNLFTGGVACGMRIECNHCARAMAEITPRDVFNQVVEFLNG